MRKILQARLQQYVNHELPEVQAGFRKGRETRDQLLTSARSSKKQESSKKTSFLFYWLCRSLWLCGSQQIVENSERYVNTRPPDMTPEKSVCRSGRTVRSGHGTTGWFQIGKGVCQDCILSLCLFNFYAEYIRRNAGLNEAQAGIKIAGRNINNLRYANDNTLWQKVKKN